MLCEQARTTASRALSPYQSYCDQSFTRYHAEILTVPHCPQTINRITSTVAEPPQQQRQHHHHHSLTDAQHIATEIRAKMMRQPNVLYYSFESNKTQYTMNMDRHTFSVLMTYLISLLKRLPVCWMNTGWNGLSHSYHHALQWENPIEIGKSTLK